MSGRRPDVAVIGAGAIGTACALRLAQAGLRVTLLEAGEPGAATPAAAGILGAQMESQAPTALLQLALASRTLFPDFAAELRTETGIDCELRLCGVLELAFTDRELQELSARRAWQAALGLRCEWLAPAELARLGVRAPARGGLLFPDDARVDNRALLAALRCAALASGVEVRAARVLRCAAASGAVELDLIAGGATAPERLGAGAALVSAGAWSGRVVGLPPLAVRPVRGQMVAFAGAAHGGPVLHARQGYAVPRDDGRLLVGATVEEAGFAPAPTAEGRAQLLAAAALLRPDLQGAEPTELWAGLRPGTSDALPLLGPIEGQPALFACTGHYRSGILLSPLTAQLACDLVLGRAPAFDLGPFRPGRARST